jgi:hypothetical protein
MIEATVTVAMSGIVLMTGMSLIHTVLGVQRNSQKSIRLSTSGSNLSRVFRQDVHRATKLEYDVTDETAAGPLSLHGPDNQTVTYQVRENRLSRVETVDGATRHQDEFAFPAGGQLRLTVSDNPKRVTVSVRQPLGRAVCSTIPVQDSSHVAHGFLLRLEATMGRDVRFVATTEAGSRFDDR